MSLLIRPGCRPCEYQGSQFPDGGRRSLALAHHRPAGSGGNLTPKDFFQQNLTWWCYFQMMPSCFGTLAVLLEVHQKCCNITFSPPEWCWELPIHNVKGPATVVGTHARVCNWLVTAWTGCQPHRPLIWSSWALFMMLYCQTNNTRSVYVIQISLKLGGWEKYNSTIALQSFFLRSSVRQWHFTLKTLSILCSFLNSVLVLFVNIISRGCSKD